MNFTNEEYYDMLILYGECRQNARAAAIEYAVRFPRRQHPRPNVILRLANRARHTSQLSLNREGIGGVDRITRNQRNEGTILRAFENNPKISIRNAEREYNISRSSIQRILKEHKMHAYHYTRIQDLLPGDYAARIEFCTWLIQQHQNNPNFVNKILFTDEANFSREGTFNVHNYHFWGEENPYVITRRSFQVKFGYNIWAGILGDILIGPVELPPRLNGRHYASFLENDLPEFLEDIPLHIRRDMFYQHDGAPAHFAVSARRILNQKFPNSWIGRRGPINWPARSPDLNPMDFFIWGHMKEFIYRDSVNSDIELLTKLIESLETITPQMIQRTYQNLIKRAHLCIEVQGGHFEHLL